MNTLTLRISDTKYAKTRFELQASKGDKQRGLELLDKLDSLQ